MKHIPTIAFLFAVTTATAAPQWFKGNTHTHTLWSDGNDFPENVAAFYRDNNYHFLVLSDHNILSRSTDRWMKEKSIRGRQKALGKTAVQKAATRFGDDWLESRGEGDAREFRLKTLNEIRPLFEKPGEFVFLEGEEITVGGKVDGGEQLIVHINAANISELIKPIKAATIRETLRKNLQAVHAHAKATGRPAMAHLNHPNFGWGVSAEDLAHAIEEQYFEVYNGHPGIRHNGDSIRPGDEKIWDIANTIRISELAAPPLYGVSTDDSHHYHGGDVSPGRGWIQVRAEKLEPDTLINAMHAGDFYSSTGVALGAITFDPDKNTLSIEITPEKGVNYTTTITGTRKGYDPTTTEVASTGSDPYKKRLLYSKDIGATLATTTGTSVTYQLGADELYVRATVTSSKPHPNPSFKNQFEQAWTQPVGWKRHLK